MKKLATLLFATAATPAFAADLVELPPPPPPPVIVAAPVWTGLYVGAHAGGAFHRGGSGLTDAFIRIPATPGSPARPAVPATPFIPGTPGDPGRPAIPPTAPVTVEPGLVEFSFACAGAGPAAACSGAIINNGVETPVELTRAELSAAIAEAGGDPGAAEAPPSRSRSRRPAASFSARRARRPFRRRPVRPISRRPRVRPPCPPSSRRPSASSTSRTCPA